ncbi:MAG TPA: Mov34/MPN/PAD-1 family protein, partial [Humisphaera sp.]
PALAPLDPGHTEFQAIFRQSVLDQIRVHAEENPGIEVCGVVVGTVFDNPQAAFVYVDGMIRGESSAGRSTQVTFTAETWQHIHKVMEERHPGKRIIGWYHTHPGFGVFLSEMDLFIQRNFFNAPWQMAFVYDPRSHDAGAFAWRQAQVRRVDFVLDDESSGRPAAELLPPPPPAGGPAVPSAEATFHEDPAAPVDAATLTELADRVRVLEARVKWMLAGFAILALVAIIWPLVVTVVMPQQHAAPAGPAQNDPQQPAPAARPGQQDRTMLPLR